MKRARALASRSWRTIILMVVHLLVPRHRRRSDRGFYRRYRARDKHGIQIKITSQLASLVNIFVLPLISIVPALLYLKMRQFGGETLNDMMTQLEESEGARSNWQQRMRKRLTMNTPINTPQNRTVVRSSAARRTLVETVSA